MKISQISGLEGSILLTYNTLHTDIYIQCNSYQNLGSLFGRNWQVDLKIHMEI